MQNLMMHSFRKFPKNICIILPGTAALVVVSYVTFVTGTSENSAAPFLSVSILLARSDLKRIVANLSLSWAPFVLMLENM